MRVLGVRIAWHVKGQMSNTVKRSEFRMCLGTRRAAARAGNEQVGMRAPCSEQGRRRACMGTPANRMHAATVLGERTSKYGVVVVPTPADPIGFLKSTRDDKARNAAKEHTNEERSGSRNPGVRRPGAVLGQSPARSKFFRAAMHAFST